MKKFLLALTALMTVGGTAVAAPVVVTHPGTIVRVAPHRTEIVRVRPIYAHVYAPRYAHVAYAVRPAYGYRYAVVPPVLVTHARWHRHHHFVPVIVHTAAYR